MTNILFDRTVNTVIYLQINLPKFLWEMKSSNYNNLFVQIIILKLYHVHRIDNCNIKYVICCKV